MFNVKDIVVFRNDFKGEEVGEIVEILKVEQSICNEKVNKTIYRIKYFESEKGCYDAYEENIIKAYFMYYWEKDI